MYNIVKLIIKVTIVYRTASYAVILKLTTSRGTYNHELIKINIIK